MNNDKLYKKYKEMIKVCYYKNCKDYKYYGGKGIVVCDTWLDKEHGYENFKKDIGEIGYNNFKLIRIDKSGNYTKDNLKCIPVYDEIPEITKHPLYSTYVSMINRCNTGYKTNREYYIYKGISVCERWLKPCGVGFMNFLNDMGERPYGYSLDRIDNNRGYSPENCKWSTKTQQVINRGIHKNNKSGKKGVYWDKNRGKWEAVIFLNKKRVILGHFDDFNEAVSARKNAEDTYYREILS